MNFLYYPYGGICRPHPHIAINKVNGLVAAAPLTPSWPGPPPLVDIPNWDDDIYLKRRGADAFFGSRFAESEPYAQHNVFLLPLWPPIYPSLPTFSFCAPTVKWHQEHQFLHRRLIIHPADRSRLAKPGLLWIPMVQATSITPSSTLRGSACTIPMLDFNLPIVLFHFHRPYHSPTTTGQWCEASICGYNDDSDGHGEGRDDDVDNNMASLSLASLGKMTVSTFKDELRHAKLSTNVRMI
jgi:hypothetical protein